MNEHPTSSEPDHFPTRFLTVAVMLTGTVLAWFGWNTYNSYDVTRVIRERLLRVEELQGEVTHLNEVLTMSARMAAATGDLAWEERHHRYEPILDKAIKEIIELEPHAYPGEGAAETDAANIKMGGMEERAFALVRQKRAAQARELLFSAEYEAQKRIYSQGITRVKARIKKNADDMLNSEQQKAFLNSLAVLVSLPTLLFAWLIGLRLLRRWRDGLSEGNRRLDQQAQDLIKLNAEFELRVDLRTAELQAEIAERRRAEEALVEERHLFRTLMDNLPDYIYFKDRGSRFIRTNQALANSFGLADPAQVVGKTDFDFFTPEHAQPALADEQEIIRTGQPMLGKEEKETWPDGRETWAATTKMPLRDVSGHIIGTFGISRHFTERKRAEQELQKTNDTLRALIKASPVAIVMTDTEGMIQLWNPAAERDFGWRESEVVGRFNPVIPQDRLDEFKSIRVVGQQGQGITGREVIRQRMDGTSLVVSLSMAPIRDAAGRVTATVGLLEDITARKRADEALRESRQFLEGILKAVPVRVF